MRAPGRARLHLHMPCRFIHRVNGDHPVGGGQLACDLVGPFHQFETRSGKDVAKARVFPFARIAETVEIKMPDRPGVSIHKALVGFHHRIGRALDAALYTAGAQQVADKRGFASPQIATQFNAGVTPARPGGQMASQCGGPGLGGCFVGPCQTQQGRAFYNRCVSFTHQTIDPSALWSRIQDWARELGLSQIAVSGIDLHTAEPGLQAWLAAGFQGSMGYMASHGLKRARPAELVPGTVSVITARMDYLPVGTPEDWPERELARLRRPGEAVVSLYARGRDYHKVLRTRLQKLADRIASELGPFGHRVFTDSAPVLEAELATRSGLGWRGKHTLVLSREAGSMFFLGELFVDLALPLTPAVSAHCGQCQACLQACPTQAIVAPHRLDARRCISYLTIEHDGPIPVDLRPLVGNRVYGCDDCQLVCPWNKFAQVHPLPDWQPREGLAGSAIAQLLSWTEDEFLRRTEGSAIRRIGHARWLRNLALAAGNALRSSTLTLSEAQALRLALQTLTAHGDEVVREQVAWSLAPPAGG